MAESKTGVATLEDVDMTVFIAFCGFLYRGRYIAPPREELKEDKKYSALYGSSENKSTRILKRF